MCFFFCSSRDDHANAATTITSPSSVPQSITATQEAIVERAKQVLGAQSPRVFFVSLSYRSRVAVSHSGFNLFSRQNPIKCGKKDLSILLPRETFQ